MKKACFCLLLVFAMLVMSAFSGCGDDDDDNDATEENDDDVVDDDVADDDDDDNDTGGQGDPLLAAAGQVVITPNEENHPETIYLGGIFPSRLASGVHDDLLASVLVLEQGQEQVAIVSLDFLGFSRSRGREIQERLATYGFKKEHVLISATHTHEAPDTLGVFGPNVLISGVSPTYMAFVQDSIVSLVLDTWEQVVPVTMTAASVPVNDPLSNYPTLIADLRQPEITVPQVAAARFVDELGETVGTLVNWHSHPEVMIESTLISSDFPHWLRLRMEEQLGGTCVYISGTVGGLSTPTGVEVPARDEEGNPVLDEADNPVYLLDGSWEKARSLGYVIADMAIAGLNDAKATEEQAELQVSVEELLLPVQNPIMILAFLTGLVEYDRKDLVDNLPELCGWFGCSSDRLALVEVGPVQIISSPGEAFPESWIGRDETIIDFGEEWGEFAFPAMEGILASMDGEVPMHIGLCGNEVGYLIPEADFHPREHPDYYEEDLFWGWNTETVYREKAIDFLKRSRNK